MPELTTLFTAPVSCTTLTTWNGNLLWQGGLYQTNDPNCFPPYFASVYYSWYSPGICPHGWTSASAFSGTVALVFDAAETNAICCPRGYSAVLGQPTPGTDGLFCRASLTGTLINVFSTTGLRFGPAPANPSLTSLDAAALASPYMWHDFLQVRWHASDSEITSLMAEEAASATNTAISTTPQSPATSSPPVSSPTGNGTASQQTEPQQGSSSQLSTGAKAGIGVAISVIVLAVVALAVRTVLRRRAARRNHAVDTDRLAHGPAREVLVPQPYTKPELEAQERSVGRMELGGESQRARYELEAREGIGPGR